MQLRSFTGRTIADAMANAHAALGHEAVMLRSDRLSDGSGVILQAARSGTPPGAGIAPAMASAAPRRQPPRPANEAETTWPDFLRRQSVGQAQDGAAMARLCMLYHGIPESLVDDWIAHRNDDGNDDDAIAILTATLAPIMDFGDILEQKPGARMMIAGLAGAGRSTFAARIAIALHRAGTPVVLVHAGDDTSPAPAHRVAVEHGVALSGGKDDWSSGEIEQEPVYVVDLPALDPDNAQDQRRLRAHGAKGEIIPVIAANGDAAASDELGRAFARQGAKRLLASYCDHTGRLGAVVMAATGGDLRLAAIGDSAKPEQQPAPVSADRLAPRSCENHGAGVMSQAPALSVSPGRLASATKILAVASGKGGVGKTWFSISLAHALARQGRKVLLLDGDLGLANVDVQLSLMPTHDLSQVVAGQIALSDAVTPYAPGGFDVIAGRSGGVNMAAMPAGRFDDLLTDINELAGQYDHVILDLAAGIDPGVRRLIAEAGTCLIVTTEEPTALTDAYSLVKVIARRQPRANLRLVINMATSAAAGERTYMTLRKACEEFLTLKPPLAGIIRADPHVSQAIRHQVGLFTRSPTCDAAEDVESIGRRLLASDERTQSS